MTAAPPPGPRLGVVIPCYRSATGIGTLVQELVTVLRGTGEPFLIVLVEDATPDGGATWRAIEAAKADSGELLKIVRLARNVGQHNALLCGIEALPASVERVVTMDDDGQHRPEDIPALLRALDAGADLAIGAYDEKRHAAGRNRAGELVDMTLRRLGGLPRDFALTSFRACRRFVADEALEQAGGFSYLTASLLGATNRRVNVPVRHEPRKQGRSGYTLSRSLQLVANLLLTHSRLPLVAMTAVGTGAFLITAGVLGYVLWLRVSADVVPGWASVMLMIGVQSTMFMAAMATILLYVARCHRMLSGTRARWRVADAK